MPYLFNANFILLMLMKTFKIWLVFVLFFFGGYGVSAMAQDVWYFSIKGISRLWKKTDGFVITGLLSGRIV